jgi:O-antigen/teichoic acid export membrane protein
VSSVRRRAARSLVWTIIESSGLSGVSLLALIVFAWLLSPVEMGVATIALGVVQLLTVPVQLLFQDALVRRPEIEEAHFDTAFSASLALGLSLALVGWACSNLLARFVGVAELAPTFWVMNLSLIPTGFGTVIAARQRRNLEFRSLALRSLIGRVVGAAIGIFVALCGGGIWSLVSQQVLMATCATAVLWVMAERRPRLRFSYRHFRDLIGFGLQSIFVTSADVACYRTYTLLVGAWLGPANAGYINIAFRAVDMLRGVISGAVVQLALPLFQRYQDAPDSLRRGYAEATGFTCLLTFPLFAGLAVCAPEGVALLFGGKWAPSVPYVALLGALALPFFARIYAAPAMAAVGKPQAALPGLFVNFFVIVVGMAAIGRASLAAAACVWSVRLVASTPVDAWMLRRVSGLDFRTQAGGILCPLLASLIMAVSILAERDFLLQGWQTGGRVAAMVSLGAVVYGLVMLVLDRSTVVRLVGFASSAIGPP